MIKVDGLELSLEFKKLIEKESRGEMTTEDKGKATLEYRKHFVSVLHNSAELFIKQLMLNNTDYRVIQLKNGCSSDG